MVLDRGAWVAMVMLGCLAAGCDSAPLATPHPVDTAARSTVVPPGVGLPVFDCGNGATFALSLPCQLGMGPVFETDCSYGPADAPNSEVLRFLLAGSLPDNGGSLVNNPALGTAQRFHAIFAPSPGSLTIGASQWVLKSIDGTVTFTTGSLADRAFDGWFGHLDFVFESGTETLSCTLADGRFTTTPGDYL
jgi:hypothetical protein